MVTYLTSPVIDLTGYDKLNFSFEYFLDMYGNGYEGFKIEYTNDGVNWHVLGKENDIAVNWYPSRANGVLDGVDEYGNNIQLGGWTYDTSGWETSSIDLPSQGFDNQSQVQFRVYFASDNYNNNNADGLAIDNFVITGSPIQEKNYSDCGLGIGQNLELWLNTRTLAGMSDGDPVDQWTNISSLNPTSNISTEWTSATSSGAERPIYYDNATNNVNFNPVVSFDGSKAMYGKSGFYNQDIYIVINPTGTISSQRPTEDVFMGDYYLEDIGSEDVTGISINDTSSRYGTSPDIAAYNQGASGSYGKAIIHPTLVYDRPVIFNARINSDGSAMNLYLDGVNLGVTLDPALMQEENLTTFKEILNSRYWLGRSEFFGPSFTGDIMEIMSFSTRKSDLDRARIESYLAVKYGITLGLFPVPEIGLPHVPGAYFDSAGNALWNASIDAGYTYNVTGIGRDDCSLLHQKQAKSVDPNTFLTIGLGEIAATNGLNGNSFESDGDFLMWGSTPSTLQALPEPLEVGLGASVITTFTDVSERTWKFKEISQAGNDIPEVKVSVETSGLTSLPALTGNDAYVMIVADDENFSTNVETIFLKGNGSLQECKYDFDGVKYVKFGVAHEVISSRHIEFDGANDFIAMDDELDLGNEFTVSAWVLSKGPNLTNSDRTIVSKRAGGADGYQFFMTNDNRIGMRFNGSEIITSNTLLNNNVWTYVAFTYTGGSGRLYIDGFLDRNQNMAAPAANTNKFSIGSRYIDKNSISDTFNGKIDEVRIFSVALTLDQLRFVMNQELLPDGSGIKGAVIPTDVSKNDLTGINWDNLEAYFDMNTYIGTHLNDASGKGHRGSLKSPENFQIQTQTAPLPYVSATNGRWDREGRWENGDEMFLPGYSRVINGQTVKIDWNIVRIENNVNLVNEDVTLLGLEMMSGSRLRVRNDHGLTVTHRLQLDGFIDLQDDSQLVQTTNSDLVMGTDGYIERDQKGTSDGFNYNYWSSPVSSSGSAPNTTYSIRGVLRDGTAASNPLELSFTGQNVADGKPATDAEAATISGRWLYKYGNLASGSYSNWQYLGPDGTNQAGEGWTMKGTHSDDGYQNYTFEGVPNNGNINLPINAGNDYLVGNPYASAIDARQFLLDNPELDGTLYFWEHWGGGSHILKEYQGGYATYNLSGGVGNATYGTAHPLVNNGGVPVKLPERYIPVAQGFFVTGISDGQIKFRNSQRDFKTIGGGESVFTAAPGSSSQTASRYFDEPDNRVKIRLGFDSPNLIHRQLLLTVDPNASLDYDHGYDGLQYGEQFDDMAWMIGNENYIIQGVDQIQETTRLPLAVKMRDNGTIKITIDDLENLPEGQQIFLYDQTEGTFTDLLNGNFESSFLFKGRYKNRFFITFEKSATLGADDVAQTNDGLQVFKPVSQDYIQVLNTTNSAIDQVYLTNMLGQQVMKWEAMGDSSDMKLQYSGMATGAYIVTVQSDQGNTAHKVIID
ncbi:hypothetical protein NMS_2406 [Nonlabens marinus S1-08]|uniref:LamG-like jellyroll fold domain-containing protein n=2 Tax=Nonlabens TaxID=363408 RepID=W8VSQ6_9FLAO|nr:hypothetical protein NMS_2406 [Nonlabens marinus S1-08]